VDPAAWLWLLSWPRKKSHPLPGGSRLASMRTNFFTGTARDEVNVPLRILGIDPGSAVTGFGVIEYSPRGLTYITSGAIKTGEGDLASRLKVILDGMREIICTHEPHLMAVEHVFVNINPKSTLALGQARGAAICAGVLRDLPVFEYTALQVKQAVVGNGHARKEQVQEMVCRLLSLNGKPRADAADALACAICHAHANAGAFSRAAFRMRRGRLV
jgi:crossover junction endodeoxyribonuclease RuvC